MVMHLTFVQGVVWFESLLQMIFCGSCLPFGASDVILPQIKPGLLSFISFYEGWNFNSGNYLFTTDTK